jgi:tetratricopeptide (TPR) repeat protein
VNDESEPNQAAKKTRRAKRAAQATAPAADKPAKKVSAKDIRAQGQQARDSAAKRRAKRNRERASAAAEGLDAGELVDDALARGTHATVLALQKHFRWLQWVVILGVVGAFSWLIYGYRQNREMEKGADVLAEALHAEFGRLEKDTDLNAPNLGFEDVRPVFKSDAERLEAAAKAYRKTAEQDKEPTRSTLARMGLAGVLLSQGKYKEAKDVYAEVKQSPVAASDVDLKARALEGIGMAQEALGQADAALKSFKELANIGEEGLTVLGNYHQARLLLAKGDKEQAKKLLEKNLEKLKKAEASATRGPSFSETASRQLLQIIDPSAAPQPPGGGMSPEQLEALKAQLAEMSKGGGNANMAELLKSLDSGEPGPLNAEGPAAPEPGAPTQPAAPPEPQAPSKPAAPTPKKLAPAKAAPEPQPQAPVAPEPAPPVMPKPPAPTTPKPAPAPVAPSPTPAPKAPPGPAQPGESPAE